MNSGKTERDSEHKKATRIASEHRCLSCGKDAPSLPAHWPRHRSMGGGQAGWDYREWVPLCYECHETLDKRTGNSWREDYQRSQIIIRIALATSKWHERAARWW